MKLELKRQIFDLCENARELWNNYYNGKENYTKEDFDEILRLVSEIENDVKEIEYDVYILKESE